MKFNVDADLVPLFRGLVTGIKPFAVAQEVALLFKTNVQSLHTSYNPGDVLAEITVLLSRIISFTPQSYSVIITLDANDDNTGDCRLTIENTGVDLSKLGEILSSVSNGLGVESLDKGTRFTVRIPTVKREQNNIRHGISLLPKQYPMYYSEVNKRLSIHFSSSGNLEDSAMQKGQGEGVFLKKINAVIKARMSDPEFKVDQLASAMALSRAQLYRKLKLLTQMSPQQYLRFVRLEKAKELLQSRQKDLNVGEVSCRVGFAAKSHFTRSFQREFGFSPSKFK